MDCNNMNSQCVPYEEYIKVSELARAYVPFQKLCSIFDLEEGLKQGTIFPELARPYCRGDNRVREENACGCIKPVKHCNPCQNRMPNFSVSR